MNTVSFKTLPAGETQPAFFAQAKNAVDAGSGAADANRLVEARKSATDDKDHFARLLAGYDTPYGPGVPFQKPIEPEKWKRERWERRELLEHVWRHSDRKERPPMNPAGLSGLVDYFEQAETDIIGKILAKPEPTEAERKAEAEARAQRFNPMGYQIDRETGEIKQADDQRRGLVTTIEHREWSNEYRIRTKWDSQAGMPTPVAPGERKTKTLTLRGARRIADACEYMSEKHGGYTTFLTLTLDTDARQRVADGETTIQAEIKRFFDGANRVFQRGFQYTSDKGERVKVEPFHGAPKNWNGQGLAYCWVIEVPKNEDGEDNPHAHILMGWRVDYRHFDAWAKRIEKLWGQGFAHLEKIKEPENAGAYIAKAAGYLTKGAGQADQGEVKGNRYWIAKPCRAPGWECVGRFQAGTMGGLIRDVYSFMQWRYGHLFDVRREASAQLAKARKAEKEGQPVPDKQAIAERLTKARRYIKRLPCRASEYQIIIKGRDHFHDFMHWAQGTSKQALGDTAKHWLPNCKRDPWRCDSPRMSRSGAEYFQMLTGENPTDDQQLEPVEYDDISDSAGQHAGKAEAGGAGIVPGTGFADRVRQTINGTGGPDQCRRQITQ